MPAVPSLGLWIDRTNVGSHPQNAVWGPHRNMCKTEHGEYRVRIRPYSSFPSIRTMREEGQVGRGGRASGQGEAGRGSRGRWSLLSPHCGPALAQCPAWVPLALHHPSAYTRRVLITPPSQTRKLRPGEIKQLWAGLTSSRVATLDWRQDPPDSGAPAFSRS